MTSISASSVQQGQSPSDRMQARLQAAIASGSIKSTDQTALTSALGDIDTALNPGANAAAPAASTSIEDKVSSLIDTEVANGKLTADQASEMKGLFAQSGSGVGGAHGHHGGHRHVHQDSDTATASDASATDPAATPTTATASTTTDPLAKLLDLLKTLQSAGTQTGYAATGSATSGTGQALLVDQSL